MTRGVAVAMALVLCASAWGADKAKVRTATRDELRACMDEDDALDQRRVELDGNRDRHDAALAELQAEAKALAAEQAKVNRRDKDAVQAFNAKQDAHNGRIDALNKNAELYESHEVAFNTRLVAYNEQCSAIAYRKSNEQAILKEREQAAKERAPPVEPAASPLPN